MGSVLILVAANFTSIQYEPLLQNTETLHCFATQCRQVILQTGVSYCIEVKFAATKIKTLPNNVFGKLFVVYKNWAAGPHSRVVIIYIAGVIFFLSSRDT
jgi:hypothetical protein